MERSHRAAFSPSPGSGYWCSRVHESTGVYAAPSRTDAVTFASRLVVQNDGWCLSAQVAVSHLLSHGTSGQFSGRWGVHSLPGTHRSATVKSTRPVAATPARTPYSIRVRWPLRV
ncbi:hypothetical protein ACFQV2_31845 [Actinokineospora soli]|uniref:Uncharacterized protein n=1 Tax=Actinokineospora soli TaxID=1048753 RepID=A0ABW2TVL4_9PSEU